eukprot:TRINITY_DN17608_c0_g1_i3.p1 TRINITY_DN17608_c0_g1~~TRINITY_DN17608_c0_g1_i3.p1  ORF type:complete len:366 (-),score=56.36 TRINITY_DN17608_c0_g1_i3:489-1529(-)
MEGKLKSPTTPRQEIRFERTLVGDVSGRIDIVSHQGTVVKIENLDGKRNVNISLTLSCNPPGDHDNDSDSDSENLNDCTTGPHVELLTHIVVEKEDIKINTNIGNTLVRMNCKEGQKIKEGSPETISFNTDAKEASGQTEEGAQRDHEGHAGDDIPAGHLHNEQVQGKEAAEIPEGNEEEVLVLRSAPKKKEIDEWDEWESPVSVPTPNNRVVVPQATLENVNKLFMFCEFEVACSFGDEVVPCEISLVEVRLTGTFGRDDSFTDFIKVPEDVKERVIHKEIHSHGVPWDDDSFPRGVGGPNIWRNIMRYCKDNYIIYAKVTTHSPSTNNLHPLHHDSVTNCKKAT